MERMESVPGRGEGTAYAEASAGRRSGSLRRPEGRLLRKGFWGCWRRGVAKEEVCGESKKQKS